MYPPEICLKDSLKIRNEIQDILSCNDKDDYYLVERAGLIDELGVEEGVGQRDPHRNLPLVVDLFNQTR